MNSNIGKTRTKETNKTVVFMVKYLGQCGCGCREKITRKIELKETQTLDDLHEAIIYKSFGWFDPHLYSFYFDNKPYSKNRNMEYTFNPEPDDSPIDFFGDFGEPHSTKTKLKDLTLQKNQKFLFVFDFGDDHHFSVRVVGFGNVQKGLKYPLVLEVKGNAPEQYPEPDEEPDSL